MEKKVDLSALVGSAGRNSMTERAPLAPGWDEGAEAPAVPSAQDALEKAGGAVPYDALNTPKEQAEATARAGSEDLSDAKDAPAAIADSSRALVDALQAQVDALTKRLEDFGAIPVVVDNTPREPVVTMTQQGNKRTDW